MITIEQLNEYKCYLLKHNLITYVKNYLRANEEAIKTSHDMQDTLFEKHDLTDFVSLNIIGDLEYDDQQSYYFCLRDITIAYANGNELSARDFDEWRFIDGANCSELFEDYEIETVVVSDCVEPFRLRIDD